MKKQLMAFTAVSALSLGIATAAHASTSHLYAGLSAGYFDGYSGLDRTKGNEGVSGLQLGWHINKNWQIEVSGLTSHGSDDTDLGAITVAYRLLGERTQLLGLVAAEYIRPDRDGSHWNPALGLALSHYFTDNWELRLAATGGFDDAEYLTSRLSLNYHFGSHFDEPEVVYEEPVAEPVKAEPVVVMTKTLRTHFDFDKSIVREEDKAQIREVSDAMRNSAGSTATLVGHTDSRGTDEYNQSLSERRAAAVRDEMISEGVSPDAIEAYGRGESEPVASNDTAEGRQENRRVEAVVTGLTQ